MIAVVRGRSRSPDHQAHLVRELDTLREEELPRVRAIRTSRRLEHRDFKSSRVVRDALHDDQYGKCCYCERYGDRDYGHLEHFRPKARANRHPGHAGDSEGYYWLAWTWQNLLFACGDCNLKKNTRFPLASGCEVLVPEAIPPGREHAWLIDPAATALDPFEHIQFRPVADPSGKTRWRPVPRKGSLRGYWTIKTLGLDRPGLLERYGKHVRLYVRQAIDAIKAARVTDQGEALRSVWQQQLTWLCHPEQELIALSCDVLDYYFPRAFRRRWQLDDPRPAAASGAAAPSAAQM